MAHLRRFESCWIVVWFVVGIQEVYVFHFCDKLRYSPALFNNFASGAADIGDQMLFRCSRSVFKLSGEIKFD